MNYLRQSTASQTRILDGFVDDTDFKTPETGLTIANTDIKLSKNGTASVNKNSGGGIHIVNGGYAITFDATDTNTVGELDVSVKVAGALLIWKTFFVVEEAVYDLFFAVSATGSINTGDAFARLETYRLGELMSAALASQPFTASLLGDLTQDNADDAGTQQFTTAALMRLADEVLVGATHNVTNSWGRRVRQIQENNGYLGKIWIDTVNGTAGSVDFENGTIDNPVDNIADANLLSASVNIPIFAIYPGSSITFAATQTNQVFIGQNWTLALGGQNIAGSIFEGATVSGIATGVTQPQFNHCTIGNVTLPPTQFNGSTGFDGTLTIGSAGQFDIVDCFSLIAGTSAPMIDLGVAVGPSDFNIRGWQGGLDFSNIEAGDVISLEGTGGIVTIAGSGGSINIRGIFEDVIDNSSAAVVITQIATLNRKSLAGYDDGAVWIDTSGTNSGIITYVDGTADNPVNNIADATTIAALVGTDGVRHFELVRNADITLAQTYTAYVFGGVGGTIALGGQDVSFCIFSSSLITGIGIGAGKTFFSECLLTGVSLPTTGILDSSFSGTFICTAADDYSINNCRPSEITAMPIFDLGAAIGATNLQFNNWNGNMELQNVGATGADVVEIHGKGNITINANCTGGTITLFGDFIVTDNGTSTVIYDNNTQSIIDIEIDTGTTIPTDIAALPTASEINAEMVDVIAVDTYGEPTSAVAATTTIAAALMWVKTLFRNKMTQTATTTTLRNDSDTLDISSSTVSDDSTTFIRGKHT